MLSHPSGPYSHEKDWRRYARLNQKTPRPKTPRPITVQRKNKNALWIFLRMSAMFIVVAAFTSYSLKIQYESWWIQEFKENAITLSGLNGESSGAHHHDSNPNAQVMESDTPETILAVGDLPRKNAADSSPSKKAPIAWLMSFPNSGASTIMQAIRKASNCMTATNYPSQGSGWKGKPSVPVIKGADGEDGPFLEVVSGRDTGTQCSSSILTSTHCTGYCSDYNCSLASAILTPPAFHVGCLSAVRRDLVEDEVKSVPVVYDAALVGKAIHLFRHPIDAVISRFNDRFDSYTTDVVKVASGYPQTSDGFRQWCADDNAKNKPVLDSADAVLRDGLEQIPCFHEFLLYARWHNLAFSMTNDLDLPTLLLDYKEFEKDFPAARKKVLSFLGAPLVDESEEFPTEENLRDYFTDREKKDIRAILELVATTETWEQLKSYDFESSSFAEDTVKHLYLLEAGHLFI